MKPTPIALAVAGLLAAGAAQAQTTTSSTTYTGAYHAYQQQQAAYQADRAAYEAARLKWENDRSVYDARWGAGAYERAYGPFRYTPSYTYGYAPTAPAPTVTYPYAPPATTYPYGTASTYPYTSAPYAGAYGMNAAYGVPSPCVGGSRSLDMAALSAAANASLAGKTLSSIVEVNRAILGAVVDRSVGERAVNPGQCDAGGYYYLSEQTQPYREGYYDAQGRWVAAVTGAYANCRIAPAPTDANAGTWRFVKVCPDASGRFRISG